MKNDKKKNETSAEIKRRLVENKSEIREKARRIEATLKRNR